MESSGSGSERALGRDDWREEVHAHARGAYPEECCGLVTRGPDGWLRAHRCRNVQDELHARDPREHPRTARTGFTMDPADWIRVQRWADAAGAEVVAVYHSHPDAGATFSAEDRRRAAPAGEPVDERLRAVVVSVVAGDVRGDSCYGWDGVRRPLAGAN